jgi:hypothetical protein
VNYEFKNTERGTNMNIDITNIDGNKTKSAQLPSMVTNNLDLTAVVMNIAKKH